MSGCATWYWFGARADGCEELVAVGEVWHNSIKRVASGVGEGSMAIAFVPSARYWSGALTIGSVMDDG